MSILVSPLQLRNASTPMLVIELGMIVLLHPKTNALLDVSMIALQLSRESYFELPLSTRIDVRLVQLLKAVLLISVTELGIVILVRLLQLSKA